MLVDAHGHARALQQVCLLFQARVRARALQRVDQYIFHREKLPAMICQEARSDFSQADFLLKVMGTGCDCKRYARDTLHWGSSSFFSWLKHRVGDAEKHSGKENVSRQCTVSRS